MSNASFTAQDTAVLALASLTAPHQVTSEWIDDQLCDTYQRLGIRPGLLKNVAGIESRRWWDMDTTFDESAAGAGLKAMQAAGIAPSDVDVLISTSVCKHHLEPSLASAVHHRLGLPSSAWNFDLANACLGFMNAIWLGSQLIDSGQARHVLIVDGEGSRYTQEQTIKRLQGPATTLDDVFAEFASLTLGSGAVAAVLGRSNQGGHRVIGGVSRSATEHHNLCVGTLEKMTTDTRGLLDSGLQLAEECFLAAEQHDDWLANTDWYILHQVSKVHTDALCQRLGLDISRVPMTFPYLGNVGPASVPLTIVEHMGKFTKGDRVLCMGIGSGLNTMAVELQW